MCENEDLYGLRTNFIQRRTQRCISEKIGSKKTCDARGVVYRNGLMEKV